MIPAGWQAEGIPSTKIQIKIKYQYAMTKT
jgi:hypothetical protein